MNAPKRICAYYSVGPHYRRMLERLRQDHPDAVVAAWIPPGLTLTDTERRMADEIVVTERAHFSPTDVRACARLVRRIRAMRFDVFAVMFDSPQLQTLAALSGAKECVYTTPRGHRVPAPTSVIRVAAVWLGRNLWGRLVYAAVWLAVRVLKTGS
jgi:hypothetical protein